MPPEMPADRPPLPRRLRTLADVLRRRIGSRGLAWSALALGVVVVAFAVWPLAAAVWDLLGLRRPQAFHVAVFGAGAVLVIGGLAGLRRNRGAPIRLAWLIAAAWTVAAGAVALMTALAWLALGTPAWDPPTTLTPRALDAIATRAFAIVAGLGGVALLVISYRRQRTTEQGEDREKTKLFTERFYTASEKLGSDEPAVRLAGVHALAHLADDAPTDELVQMVIDVLCAYLRLPYSPEPGPIPRNASRERREHHRERELAFTALREVRHTIIRTIGHRLGRPTRWRAKNYDFTGVVFDGGDLGGAHFTGGNAFFVEAEFVAGRTSFSHARFTGGRVYFSRARFRGGDVDFIRTRFSGSRVTFDSAELAGGQLEFDGARFADGRLFFRDTRFGGAAVSFNGARFTGSEVSFTAAESGGHDAQGTCPTGLLEALTDRHTRGEVTLPQAWRPGGSTQGRVPSGEPISPSRDK